MSKELSELVKSQSSLETTCHPELSNYFSNFQNQSLKNLFLANSARFSDLIQQIISNNILLKEFDESEKEMYVKLFSDKTTKGKIYIATDSRKSRHRISFYFLLGVSMTDCLCLHLGEVSTPILSFTFEKANTESVFRCYKTDYFQQMNQTFGSNCAYLGTQSYDIYGLNIVSLIKL